MLIFRAGSPEKSFAKIATPFVIYPQVTAGSKTYIKTITKVYKASFNNQLNLLLSFDPSRDYRYIEYNIEFPKSLKLFFDSRDVKGGRIAEGKNGQQRYQYIYTHPFALSAEPAQIDTVDFSPYFHFSTYENPLAFGREIEKALQSKANVSKEIQTMADNITEGITDDYQQAKALYNWVSKEIRYVGDFMGENDYAPHEASYVLISGSLPRKQTRLVQAWIELYQESLMIDWKLAVSGQEPLRIEPLR